MQLTIDTNTIDFQLKQGNEIFVIEGKRNRGIFTDTYTSDNKSLVEFVKDSPIFNVKLTGLFNSITDFENALHKLFFYCKITTGSHDFLFTGDNISLSETITGVVKDEINVSIKKNATQINADITLKIMKTAS